MEVLFDGRDIRVVAQVFEGAEQSLVVTFTGRAAKPPVEKGFGEAYFEKRRISAIHFISKDNHWWQTPEVWQAFDVLRNLGILAPGRDIILYGSSMGGYAALRFSGALRPKRIVVFSPQYSIDGIKVPFEKRWRDYAAKLDFSHDNMEGAIDGDAEILAVFDPLFRLDALHIRKFEAHRPVTRVGIPFAGHNTARFLGEIGTLGEVTKSLLDGSFDLAAFRREYRELRQTASLFWHGLAQSLQEHRRPAASAVAALLAVKLLHALDRMRDRSLQIDILHGGVAAAAAAEQRRQAEAWLAELRRLAGSSWRTAVAASLAARASGDSAAALKEAEAAVAKRPEDLSLHALHARCLVEAGNPGTALAVIEQRPREQQQAPALLLARGRAEAALGRWEEAKATLRRFCGLERRNAEARFLLALCWLETGRPDAVLRQLEPVLHTAMADSRLARDVISLLHRSGHLDHARSMQARQGCFDRICDLVLSQQTDGWNRDPVRAVASLRERVRAAGRNVLL
jgi:tetratricopeptide (TPR) repeat protein